MSLAVFTCIGGICSVTTSISPVSGFLICDPTGGITIGSGVIAGVGVGVGVGEGVGADCAQA
ncbi:MAG: hypothetical protein DI555_16920 [Novosphingobium pentaromativorans]|uniref:Uncharacterized protein n=1 Tax=Novosphingobium pentaromativorans TaxID=205844 RepID=A0A2W5NK09_9SPHN|nr:MAG: hypothetical protein DI555_16920 [Novosphingobium pentaromativorans]